MFLNWKIYLNLSVVVVKNQKSKEIRADLFLILFATFKTCQKDRVFPPKHKKKLFGAFFHPFFLLLLCKQTQKKVTKSKHLQSAALDTKSAEPIWEAHFNAQWFFLVYQLFFFVLLLETVFASIFLFSKTKLFCFRFYLNEKFSNGSKTMTKYNFQTPFSEKIKKKKNILAATFFSWILKRLLVLDLIFKKTLNFVSFCNNSIRSCTKSR